MAKERHIDPGLQYFQEIHFNRIRGKHGLKDRWVTTFGKAKAERLLFQREKIQAGTPEFYEFKNSDPEISKSFSEAYDGEIIRKACNYIDSKKEYFGKTILEVGCESGYMTGFLAKTFPDSKIVSIDRSKNAVDIASHKIESLGITNVELRVASLEDVTGTFDTVFCMRTIQENLNYDIGPYRGDPVAAQISGYVDLTEEYTRFLVSHLNVNGNLIIFERISHDPLMCGWMMRLCISNCGPMLETYSEINCEEAGDLSIFQAFVCHNGFTDDPQSMIDFWKKDISIEPSRKGILTNWSALIYLANNAGKLIRGVHILNSEGRPVGRFAAFYDKDDDSIIYFLQGVGDDIHLASIEKKMKEALLQHLQEMIDVNVQAGHHFEEIDPKEDYLEGTNVANILS